MALCEAIPLHVSEGSLQGGRSEKGEKKRGVQAGMVRGE